MVRVVAVVWRGSPTRLPSASNTRTEKPVIDGSSALQLRVIEPTLVLVAPKLGAAGTGVLVMTQAWVPMSETLPLGSKATYLRVVSAEISMGPV